MIEMLNCGHWPELYRLMVARGFPDVPPRYADAVPFFEQVKMYGVMDGSSLAAGFVFGPPEEGIAYFDVVCAGRLRGKWGTPMVLRELFQLAFVKMGLKAVWVQPENKTALKAALQAGFVPATDMNKEKPVLMMTPWQLPKRFRDLLEVKG